MASCLNPLTPRNGTLAHRGFGKSECLPKVADSGEANARPRNASPTREIQALAQIPAPKVDTLATAAITGAPTATPATRTA